MRVALSNNAGQGKPLHLGLGKLDRRTGKRYQAPEHLATATTMYRGMGMTHWLEQAETGMDLDEPSAPHNLALAHMNSFA